MIVKAYAKINIALNVLARRPDGYHDLDMIMAPLDLHDSIEINLMPPSYLTTVTCDDFDLAADEYNLCSTAVTKMREFYKFKEHFRIHIHKRIPMSAGLGGGSSDAAATVRGIISLLKLKVVEQDIIKVCRSIGSDVPFFYKQIPARVRGTGEMLTPIKIAKPYYVLLIKPSAGLKTKKVFETYDQTTHETKDIDPVIRSLELGDSELLAQTMFNLLEDTSMQLCPEIAAIKQSLHEDGLSLVMMTGSGSTVFALSEQLHKLEKVTKKYVKLGHKVLLTQFRIKERNEP